MRTWDSLIEEVWGRRAERFTRYAIKKEPGVFNDFLLNEFIDRLPDGYSLHMIDEHIYQLSRQEDWSLICAHCSPTYENYREHVY